MTIDKVGRIVIPIQIRRALNIIERKTKLNFYMEENRIILEVKED